MYDFIMLPSPAELGRTGETPIAGARRRPSIVRGGELGDQSNVKSNFGVGLRTARSGQRPMLLRDKIV
jgi:hypothetical protein